MSNPDTTEELRQTVAMLRAQATSDAETITTLREQLERSQGAKATNDPAQTPIWLIYSNEHKAWWRQNRAGYTCHLEAAGRYTKAEADYICRDANRGPKRFDEDPPYEVAVIAPEFAAERDSALAKLKESAKLAEASLVTIDEVRSRVVALSAENAALRKDKEKMNADFSGLEGYIESSHDITVSGVISGSINLLNWLVGLRSTAKRVRSAIDAALASQTSETAIPPDSAARCLKNIWPAIGDMAERVALDLDHNSMRHPKWYSAVKRARRYMEKLEALLAPSSTHAPGGEGK